MSESELLTNGIHELDELNKRYNIKKTEYDTKLNLYNEYIRQYSSQKQKSIADYNYLSNYKFNIDLSGNSNPRIKKSACLTNCVNDMNCIGASFNTYGSNEADPTGSCYMHTYLTIQQNELISDNNFAAIVSTSKYYLTQLKNINDELKSINNERQALYNSLNPIITTTQTSTQSNIVAFNNAEREFIENNNKLNNALANLGTSDEKNNFGTTIYKQQNLQFQLLLIVLYGIIFFVFGFFDIDANTSKIILLVTAIMTFMIIFNNLYQYMQ